VEKAAFLFDGQEKAHGSNRTRVGLSVFGDGGKRLMD